MLYSPVTRQPAPPTPRSTHHNPDVNKCCELWVTCVKVCNRFRFQETQTMQKQESKLGFTAFAETWNGRLAMLGFVIGLATELLTGQGILAQLGLM
ncbi:chlorophyll a/b-binding protein [Trichothermofontia sichuanensis B231]|uniref:chlorophyll a/b-binding protein n=1 Tax=Trichothermofontia sichuanensis TaxID=3045816 RepID=UPI0022467349|nr:chlorophyll a/b-binding protein [Trichothermofontia sichuanensis]UZQ56325.1 chlorophyll a/b-binding protein [Trichothermofontia sichuanensis B231]